MPETYTLSGVEIFAAGTWNSDVYDVADLDHMVSAFGHVGFNPPLKLGHDNSQPLAASDGMPAIGWVKNLRRTGNKLVCDLVNLPKKVYEAIKRRNYDRVSSEIYWDWESNGKTWPRVLKALSLLGAEIPAVTDLAALETLYDAEKRPYKRYDFGMMDMMPDTMPRLPMKDKATVKYRTGGEDGNADGLVDVCGNCRFYQGSPDVHGEGQYVASCALVTGDVASGQVCDLYEPSEAFQSFKNNKTTDPSNDPSGINGGVHASDGEKGPDVDEKDQKIAELTAQLAAKDIEKSEIEKKYSESSTKVAELSAKLPETEQKLATLEAEKAELAEQNRKATKQAWFTSMTSADNLKMLPVERPLAEHLYDLLDGVTVKAYADANGKEISPLAVFQSLFDARKPGTFLFKELSIGNATETAGAPDVKSFQTYAEARSEVTRLAKAYMQEHGEKNFKLAVNAIYAKHPELKSLAAGVTPQGRQKVEAGAAKMSQLFRQ